MTTENHFSELVANPPPFTFAVPPKPVGFWVLYPGNATKIKFTVWNSRHWECIK